jgi:gliding motility-associated-like protein
LSSLTACDQDSNTQNGVTGFNLELQTPIILTSQSGSVSNYAVTYYTTQALATSGTFNIIPTLNYQGSNNQTIWFRVENLATDCFAIGSFTLDVNAPLVFATPPALSVCDNDAQPNNQFTTFNLLANGIVLPAGHTATYYPSYTAAITNGTPILASQMSAYQNVQPAVQTLGVLITTPDGCKSYTTLDIRVLPIPTPKTDPPVLEQCDDLQPPVGTELFDLTVNENYIRNNDPSVTFSYFTSLSDAEQNINAIGTPTSFETATGIIYIRVNNTYLSSTGYCHVIVEQEVIVNPLPLVTNVIYNLCEADTNGQEFFDLTSQIPALLGTTQLPSDFSVSFYTTLAAAQLGTPSIGAATAYLNTSNPQDIYVRVVNNATGCVTTSGVLTLRVEARAVASGPQTYQSCDEYTNPHDGVHQMDLGQFATLILAGQDPVQFLVTYHTSQADADSGVGSIIDIANYITQADTDVVYVRVTNSNTVTPCYATTTINIYIERYPDPTIVTQDNVNVICVDYTNDAVIRPLLLEIDNPISGTYTYQWFDSTGVAIPGQTNATYLVDDADPNGATRSYTVEVTSALGCETMSASFEVIQSGPAVISEGLGYTVTNAFAESQIITVSVEGYGTYQYSLNDGPLQDSPVFTNVPLGVNTITVWDTEGGLENSCEALIIEEVQTIGYPLYFTPNGDGINDTWNIVGLDASAKIHIFDRFGKLIKQISPEGLGWDGTYNGQFLPSTDYWFTVQYQEQATKEFKAHFSLKR